MSLSLQVLSKEPIVTAEKLLEYKRKHGHLRAFNAPETVLVCYQRSTMEYLLKTHPTFHPSSEVTHLYLAEGRPIGILGDWGVGAPGLAIKMEELIALGTKRFVAIGTAGGLLHHHTIASRVLCEKALAEDGVAHLYLQGERSAESDEALSLEWRRFEEERSLVPAERAMAWSFSALFKESVEDVHRVQKEGCTVVEMEAATLYAIAKEKNVQALTLFVISDTLSEDWTPRTKEQAVRTSLHDLADLALEFCGSRP
ncbi:MAG: hypothetical protein FJZ58_03030 [Chlamydiae bacterium]|nr:hypothetical protein [Chlamydiota bacterium]